MRITSSGRARIVVRTAIRTVALVTALTWSAVELHSQGSLASQGYGYPTGQLSSRALGVGGATAETDPASAINPAAIGLSSRYSISMLFEPEFRRTSVSGGEANTRTIRFPNFMLTGSVGRFAASASFTTFLDRTFSSSLTDTQIIAGDTVASTLTNNSNGAMNDARFAVSYWVTQKLQLGAAVHGLTGENRIFISRLFPDSVGVGGVTQASVINFSGRMYSLGAVYSPTAKWLLGASARFGGPLDAQQDAVVIGEATAPRRVGLGASYYGIPNTTLSARFDATEWSAVDPLGSAVMTTHDATEIGLGVDVLGPRLGGVATIARLGFRDRQLPFGLLGEQIGERTLSGGLGIPLGRSRGQLDLALQRAARSAAGVDERAWLISIGFGIRP
ncbi:MAG: hypothetical protein ACKVS7_10780 [Gemmatimonadaceae bacterium]